jgi:hypothetical protein
MLATWEAEIRQNLSSRLVWTNNSRDPIFQITTARMDWRNGSSCRALALQAQRAKFKTQSHQKKYIEAEGLKTDFLKTLK